MLAYRLADAGRLASDLDPEEWHAITTGFYAATRPILERFGGTPRWRGDELTAIFGYRVAQEDAAERAVRAGPPPTTTTSKLTQPCTQTPHP